MKWFGRDKATVVVASAFLTGAAFAATVPFPDADGSHDIGAAAAWGGVTPQAGDTVSFAGGVTYGLSADKSLPGPMEVSGSGKTVFDFSAGSKALTVTGGLTDTASAGRETVLRGGSWNLTDGGFISYLWGNGASLLLDGVTVRANSLPKFAQVSTLASNSSCILTNGTKFTLAADCYMFCGSGSNWNTNNEFLVTGGSEIDLGVYHLRFGGSYGAFKADHVFDNRFIVRGAGSKVQTGYGSGHNIEFGYQAGNTTVIVEDGGRLGSYTMNVGGNNGDTPSCCNTVIVRTGGVFTNVQGSAIGAVQGSHSNAVYVLDGGQLNVGKKGTFAQLNIGKSDSSYNKLVLSNGLVSARWVDVGYSADSHDNRFEISGTTSKLVNTDGDAWRLFNRGHDNEVVIDHGADFSFDKPISVVPDSGAAPGSNNTFAVRHASTFRLSQAFTLGDDGTHLTPNNWLEVSGGSKFLGTTHVKVLSAGGGIRVTGGSQIEGTSLLLGNYANAFGDISLLVSGEGSKAKVLSGGNGTQVNASSSVLSVDDGAVFESAETTVAVGDLAHATQSNLVFVGSGSTMALNGSAYLNLYSSDSAIVISNGTLRLGTSGYPQFNFNTSKDDTKVCVGTNSTLVFQGEHPLLTSEGNLQVHLGGESATSGTTIRYELPPNGYAEAPVQHVMQVWAGSDLSIEITGIEECQKTIEKKTTFPLWQTTYTGGFASLGVFQDAIARLNATLPKGCSVQIEGGSTTPQVMTLTVRPIRGMLMIVR